MSNEMINQSPTHCIYCEKEFVSYTAGSNQDLRKTRDHLIALNQGGNNSRKNIVYACCICNTVKGGLTLQQFIEKLDRIINSPNKTAYRSTHQKLYPIIKKNVEALIIQIEPYREQLTRKGPAPKKKSEYLKNIAADVHLSVTVNP